jgi:hypothetical protein
LLRRGEMPSRGSFPLAASVDLVSRFKDAMSHYGHFSDLSDHVRSRGDERTSLRRDQKSESDLFTGIP